MERNAHFCFVAIEYKQNLVDAGYFVTENENFPSLCLVEVVGGLDKLFYCLQQVAHLVDAELFVIDKRLVVDESLDDTKSHEAMWSRAVLDKDKINQAFQDVAMMNAKHDGVLH